MEKAHYYMQKMSLILKPAAAVGILLYKMDCNQTDIVSSLINIKWSLDVEITLVDEGQVFHFPKYDLASNVSYCDPYFKP